MEINISSRLAVFLALLICGPLAVACDVPSTLPQWLQKAIGLEKSSTHPGTFEEAKYEGKRVFQFTRGDRADMGDEHILFSEDGEEICKFGGFVGHVTSGSCSLDKIIYVRTLYPRNP